jgi:hypothetical protein
LKPSSGPAGSRVNATASGFQPGETVQFSFQAVLVASAVADQSGVAEASFAVPQEFSAFSGADLEVLATGGTSDRGAEATFMIT